MRVMVDQIKVKDLMVPLAEYPTVPEVPTLVDVLVALEDAQKKLDLMGTREAGGNNFLLIGTKCSDMQVIC
jgi:hypothetical protein